MGQYHDILGVDVNAPIAAIKTAYRKLSSKFHPDKAEQHKWTDAEKTDYEHRFKRINEAYTNLKNGVADPAEFQQQQRRYSYRPTSMDAVMRDAIIRQQVIQLSESNVMACDLRLDGSCVLIIGQPIMDFIKGAKVKVDVAYPVVRNDEVSNLARMTADLVFEKNTPVGFHHKVQNSNVEFIFVPVVGQHDNFGISELDIFVNVDINMIDALLKREIKVEHPDGSFLSVSIPSSFNINTMLRIPNRGMTDTRGNVGHLFIKGRLFSPALADSQIAELSDVFSKMGL